MIVNGVDIPDEKLIEAGWTPPAVRRRRRVADGDGYWTINSVGYPVRLTDSRDTACADRFNRANYFHTKEEAEHNESVCCAGVRIIDALREAEGDCEPVDWENEEQKKYVVVLAHNVALFKCDYYLYLQSLPNKWYTTDPDAWSRVIESHEADLRLWFGIEED